MKKLKELLSKIKLPKLSEKQKQMVRFTLIFIIIIYVISLIISLSKPSQASQGNVASGVEKSASKLDGSFNMDKNSHFKRHISKKVEGAANTASTAKDQVENFAKNIAADLVNIRRNMVEKEQVSDLSDRLDAIESRVIKSGNNGSSDIDDSTELTEINIELTVKKKEQDSYTVHDSVASGTIAKAILINGVDAHTSLTAEVDPRPVLIHLADDGALPNRLKGRLKNCHVSATSYGDIASGRAMIRTERLTCTDRLTHEIVDTDITGYVTGEDGRVGVAGVIKETAGEHLLYGTASGILGGLSNAAIPDSDTNVSAFGAFTGKTTNSDRLKQGVFGGGSKSLDRLSDYYIERAEKLQPVIQVAAGRQVDIVFTKTARIGSKAARQQAKKKMQENTGVYQLKEVSYE